MLVYFNKEFYKPNVKSVVLKTDEYSGPFFRFSVEYAVRREANKVKQNKRYKFDYLILVKRLALKNVNSDVKNDNGCLL